MEFKIGLKISCDGELGRVFRHPFAQTGATVQDVNWSNWPHTWNFPPIPMPHIRELNVAVEIMPLHQQIFVEREDRIKSTKVYSDQKFHLVLGFKRSGYKRAVHFVEHLWLTAGVSGPAQAHLFEALQTRSQNRLAFDATTTGFSLVH
jgi:hypothetical protein